MSADWVSIAWWSDAVSAVAPALSDALEAAEGSTSDDPRLDERFMKARQHLANVLGTVTRNTAAAFIHGWGEAVMFALSGRHGRADMEVTWNSKSFHFGTTVAP